MPQFRYRAVGVNGVIDSGVISAADENSAQSALRLKRLTPLSIKEAKSSDVVGTPSRILASAAKSEVAKDDVKAVLDRLVRRKPRLKARKVLSQDDILRFTSELGVLLRAGLPLDRAMKVQIDAAPEGLHRNIIQSLLDSLKEGKSFSASLASLPDLFQPFYINMVRSGEASGHLDRVLRDLTLYMEKTKALRTAVISALTYPAILLIVAVFSVLIMLGFVVPEFKSLFEDLGDSLPLLTQLIVSLGELVESWGWLIIISSAIAFLWVRRWLMHPAGMLWRDSRALTFPLLGRVVLKYEVARFSRTLGTLLHNGVAMLKAVDIAVGTVGNSILRSSLEDMAPTIKRGGRLSQSMDSRVFSPVALQMVRVGEESGSMDQMLLELAKVYDAEVETEIKRMLTLLEPILILSMGGVIALIITGILLGILSVNTLVV